MKRWKRFAVPALVVSLAVLLLAATTECLPPDSHSSGTTPPTGCVLYEFTPARAAPNGVQVQAQITCPDNHWTLHITHLTERWNNPPTQIVGVYTRDKNCYNGHTCLFSWRYALSCGTWWYSGTVVQNSAWVIPFPGANQKWFGRVRASAKYSRTCSPAEQAADDNGTLTDNGDPAIYGGTGTLDPSDPDFPKFTPLP